MNRTHCLSLALILFCGAALSGNVSGIHDATELAAALTQAASGDTLMLGADIQWNGSQPLTIPSGVTIDGGRHRIVSALSSGAVLDQSGANGVVCRNLVLSTEHHTAWGIAVKEGDLLFEQCEIQCRMIAWTGGSIVLKNCTYRLELPAGSDFAEPIGVYGGNAEFVAERSRFWFAWKDLHADTGFFHNYGGNPASRLSVSQCTIVGGPDAGYAQKSRHQSVFVSDNSAGSDYVTSVTNSIVLAEVASAFRSTGSGRVSSTHNNNAGMLRNPGILAGGDPHHTRFYARGDGETPVQDRTGDFEEPNPFVDPENDDFRLVAGSRSATGATDGGPLGASPDVVAREHNARNLDLSRTVEIRHRTRGYDEALFDAWPVQRQTDQQICRSVQDRSCGPVMRFETLNNEGNPLVQYAWQSFVTIPGYEYTVRACARRGAVAPIGTWERNGTTASAVLGVAEGVVREPAGLLAAATLDGPENAWYSDQITVTAPSTHLTVFLIHKTAGAWNAVDWDDVSILAKAPVSGPVPKGLQGPVLAYIQSLPPESEEARTERHRRVAERRANVPIIVHRGASKFDPENTLEAYNRAMDLGADGVEFDPRQTADTVLYTFHDDDVERMLEGRGKGRSMTYWQLASLRFRDRKGRATESTRVPTIASLFELARQRAMLLHFDVKEAGIENILIAMLDEYDMWDHMVMVTPSPDSDRLRFHPNARLLTYKQNCSDWNNPSAVEQVLAGPGEMIFTQYDPTPVVSALQRVPPGDMPLAPGLRAWWWPDGTCRPVSSQ